MRKFYFFYFLLFCFSLTAYAQESSQGGHKICIKTAPIAFLDIYSGMSPRIGLEYRLKNSLSFYNEIGSYISGPNSIQANKGILTKMEVKKYLNKEKQCLGDYLSIELLYKHQEFTNTDSVFVGYRYEKEYSVIKNVYCLSLKYGVLSIAKKRFVVDAFFGIGLRYKMASSSLSEEENQHISPVGDYHLNVFVGEAGRFLYPNLDASIKIGYRIL